MDCKRPSVITINGRFLCQPVTGVQRYAREIISHLDDILSQGEESDRLKAKLVVPPAADPTYSLTTIAIEPTKVTTGPVWDQCVLPFHAEGIVLSLCNQGPLLAKKQIFCIHDLNTLLAPESYSRPFRLYYRLMQPLLADRATHIVTVSHFSARMLVEHGFCALDKISVIPNGHEHVHRWDQSRSLFASHETHARPYVFVLGSRARHKNVEVLFSIAEELDVLGVDILIAGTSAGMFSGLSQGSVPSNVRELGFVTDDDLAALYKNALCFAFPSLIEGFGVPALEALALGCPVVASNAAGLPEVCGDAALYADPRAPRAWLEAIRRLHTEPGLTSTLRDKGLVRSKLFSWAKGARAYFDLLITART